MKLLIIFPLSFMMLLMFFSVSWTGQTFNNTAPDYTGGGEILINDSPTTVEVPKSGTNTFDIWSADGIIVILILAITAGILGGIKVLGSGLGDFANRIIFFSVLFLGIWAALTWVSADYIFDLAITQFIWIVLTLGYTIGVASEIGGGT